MYKKMTRGLYSALFILARRVFLSWQKKDAEIVLSSYSFFDNA